MSKIKHLLVGSIQICELVKLKVLENQLKIHLISFVGHERKEQLRVKQGREQGDILQDKVIFTSR